MSLGVAVVATLAALVLTGLLVRQCIRVPRLDVGALACAGGMFSLALAAQAAGSSGGYSEVTFRAVHLSAQFLAPIALVWAAAEMVGKSVEARFSARLGLAGLSVLGVVVLATDPLSGTSFTKSWPSASAFYQIIPNGVLEVTAIVATVAAALATLVAGVRAKRYGAGRRSLFLATSAVAVAVVATDVLRATLPVNSGYAVLCLVGAALAWFAAMRTARVPLGELRSAPGGWQDDGDEYGSHYGQDTGGFAAYDTGYGAGRAYPAGFGRDPSDTGSSRWYRDDTGGLALAAPAYSQTGPVHGGFPDYGDDTGGFVHDGSDTDFDGWFREDMGGYAHSYDDRSHEDTGWKYGPYTGMQDVQGPPPMNSQAAFETGDVLSATGSLGSYGGAALQVPDTGSLYGQIAIYTLVEGSADQFDMVAQRLVEQVKALEPNTLVYVMHGVPSAPMQRILYEVYRDEEAFDVHRGEAHVRQFEAESQSYVLATNVIELGVRTGKFAPLAQRPAQPALESGRRAYSQDVSPWGNGPR